MNTNQTHELKTWPKYFSAIVAGEKRFEIRKNDRSFQAGDVLALREWCPLEEKYTDRQLNCNVSFILHGGQFGIEDGYCAMSINPSLDDVFDIMTESEANRIVALNSNNGSPLEIGDLTLGETA